MNVDYKSLSDDRLAVFLKQEDHVAFKLSSYLYKAVRNRIFNHIEHKKVVYDYQKSLIEFIETDVAATDELVRER